MFKQVVYLPSIVNADNKPCPSGWYVAEVDLPSGKFVVNDYPDEGDITEISVCMSAQSKSDYIVES